MAASLSAAEDVGRLVQEMAQAEPSSGTFRCFAQALHEHFQGLMHASLLWLPQDDAAAQPAGASTAAPAAKAASDRQGSGGSASGSGRKDISASSPTALEPRRTDMQASWQYVERQFGDPTQAVLDWSNCCVFALTPERGTSVQPPPDYPLSCTAAFHVARVGRQLLSVDDFDSGAAHFLDWQALQQAGAVSMAAAPLFLGSDTPIAVLTLASSERKAFADAAAVGLLAGVLAPYTQAVRYRTRRDELRQFVAAIMPPFVEEGYARNTLPTRMRGLPNSHSHKKHQDPGGGSLALASASSTDQQLRRAHSSSSAGGSGKGKTHGKGSGAALMRRGDAADDRAISFASTRRDLGIGKHQPFEVQPGSGDPDLDWGDFFFNLISMCIVYAYFSEASSVGESHIAVVLSMGIAAIDIALLALRWVWYDSYVSYGGLVLYIFQLYRLMVLPIANTWMSWSLLQKLSYQPSRAVIASLGLAVLACIAVGSQVRFLLHAPLQLATVLLAASTIDQLCPAVLGGPINAACMAMTSFLQLAIGLIIPGVITFALDFRTTRTFMPHVQAKRWLLQP